MRLLITGASGFVGVNMVRVLAQKPDVTVVATDLHLPDAPTARFLQPVQANVKSLFLDVTNREAVAGTVRAEGITHILHAAALTPTRQQEAAAPGKVVDVNLGGTLNLLLATAEVEQVERLLAVSSSGVYGAPLPHASRVQHEDSELRLDSLYAITKRSAELLTRRFRQLSGKELAAIRLGAIYGPMERPSVSRPTLSQLGQLAAARRAWRPVKVAGPTVTRDWTFAPDAAEAVWSLLTAESWQHDVYNVSCGYGLSFQQVVDAYVKHGLNATWVDDARDADVYMLPEDERVPLDIGRLRDASHGDVPSTELASGIEQILRSPDGRREE